MLANYRWQRDPGNPVLPPDPHSTCDSTRCMNPFVVNAGGEYRLYYSGGDADNTQRLCLATTDADRPSQFNRHGVILDVGAPHAFDAHWCVLPCLHHIGGKWHLYYCGNGYGSTGIGTAVELGQKATLHAT